MAADALIVPAPHASTSARGATVEHGLRSPDREHQVGVEESGMSSERSLLDLERSKLVRFAVVDDHLAAKRTRAVWSQERLEPTSTRAAPEPACHENGHPLARDARTRKLVQHSCERVTARVLVDRRKRQRGRLHDDGRTTVSGCNGLQAVAVKRVAERLGDGSRKVDDRIERRGDREKLCVVGERDEWELRARVKRHAWHERQS